MGVASDADRLYVASAVLPLCGHATSSVRQQAHATHLLSTRPPRPSRLAHKADLWAKQAASRRPTLDGWRLHTRIEHGKRLFLTPLGCVGNILLTTPCRTV